MGSPWRAWLVLMLALMLPLVSTALFPTSATAGDPLAGPHMDEDLLEWAIALPDVPQEVYGQPISEIRFKGNRRVESEAMLLELDSSRGELVMARKLASDLRRLWALGYFEDVHVEGELTPAGVVLSYVVKERPSIRKIIVEGIDKVKLDDINEVLDLEANEVLDPGKVRANVEKVKAVYTEKGFFLADVNFAIRPVEDEHGKVDVAIVVREAEEVIVRSIDFVGNKALSDAELRKVMATRIGGYLSVITKRAGGVYNRDLFAQDYAILRSYYADQGYLDADLLDHEIALSADRRFVHITIPVEEGPQYRVGSIGAKEIVERGEQPLFADEILMESVDPLLKVGDVASVTKVHLIREAIERRYKDSGHAFPNVIPMTRQDRENLKLYLNYEVQKGPLVYIERINIYGNEKTADKVIRREIPLLEGDLYSETGKEGAEGRVMRLGYFESVVVSTSRGSADNKIVLNIEVTERLTGTFQIGAGFSTIENFVLQAQIQYDNFLGRGTTVAIMAQLSSLRRLFSFSYSSRYFLDTKFWFMLNLFNTSNVYPSFTRQSTGFTLRWGYPIPRVPNMTAFAGYNLEWVKVGFGTSAAGGGGIFSPGAISSVPQTALISNLFADGLTSALTAGIQYDTRDNILFPTRGQFHQLHGKFASKYFGSDNQYNRYTFDSRFYVPVIKTERNFRAWLVFRANLTVGYIHSPEATGVPIFERYFPGGVYADGHIRGFRLRSLGPKIMVQRSPDPSDFIVPYGVGGNLLTALNLELEFMMIPPANIKGVIFFDTGNAFNTETVYCNDPNPDDLPKSDPCQRFGMSRLRYSMGFGFRWQSPIGPLRFEWGFPLDRQPPTTLIPLGEDPVVFEFNVGTGF
jgi:outer membrane protein insertion porin family